MKQTIRINESQLREMIAESVKRTLNELDWKTYRNASRYPNKEGNPSYGGRKDRFSDAARREFNNKYGFQTSRARFGCGSFTGNVMRPKLEINPYAKVETNYRPYGTWYPVRKEKDGYYLEKSTQHNVNDNYSRINLSDYMTDEEIMRYEDGMRDWEHYVANDNDNTFTPSNNGHYDYDNDKGWYLRDK